MNKSRTSYAILGVVFLYLIWVNFQMPMMADDYRYAQNWRQSDHLKTWMDIVEFQIRHYLEWGGRSVAHTLAQSMLFLGKPVFNLLNSLMYLIFLAVLYYHVKGSVTRRFDPMVLAGILFLAWFCFPTFGETSVWLLGSCNYLWMTTLVLLFLLPYRLAVARTFAERENLSDVLAPWMFAGGILAGWTNENTGLMMLLAIAAVNFFCWKKGRLKSWMLFGMLGAAFGYGALIFAPGNYVRVESAQMGEYSFLQNHIIDPLKTMSTLFLHQLPIYLVGVALARRMVRYKKNASAVEWKNWLSRNKEILCSGASYIILSYTALIAMFAAPTFPQRAGMGAAAFLLIGVTSLLKLDVCRDFLLFRRKRLCGIVMAGLWILSAVWAAQAYQTIQAEHQIRMAAIAEARRAGIRDMRVPPFSVKDRTAFGLVVVNDIGTDPEKFRSVYYARYFGFQTMARMKPDQ